MKIDSKVAESVPQYYWALEKEIIAAKGAIKMKAFVTCANFLATMSATLFATLAIGTLAYALNRKGKRLYVATGVFATTAAVAAYAAKVAFVHAQKVDTKQIDDQRNVRWDMKNPPMLGNILREFYCAQPVNKADSESESSKSEGDNV